MTTPGNADTESPRDDSGRLRTAFCKKLGARKKAYTTDALADFLEIDRSYLYRLYKGERIASLPVAFRIAKKLGTKVEKLFEVGV